MATVAAPPGRASIPTSVLIALGLVYVIWSSTYFAIRIVVHELPPLSSGGVRYVVAGAILLGIQRFRGAPLPTAKQWLCAIPIGVLLFLVGNGLVAMAERTIASGVAAVVCGTTPLWAGLAGPMFGERATRREWLGMVLGFAGVVVLSLGDDLRADPLAGTLLMLAPVGWAIGSLWSKKLPLAKGGSGASAQMITGGISMVLLGLATGETWPSRIGWESIAALAYLVIFGSLVAFTAYHYVLANARPALAMSYAYVNPLLALALGAVAGAEHIGLEVALGTALIAGAVVLLVGRRTS